MTDTISFIIYSITKKPYGFGAIELNSLIVVWLASLSKNNLFVCPYTYNINWTLILLFMSEITDLEEIFKRTVINCPKEAKLNGTVKLYFFQVL
jgi:hypothetical protein